MNKKILGISLTFICIIVLVIYLINFVEPQIIINCSIKPITETSYNGTKLIKKEDLIKINLEFKVIQPLFIITNRNIEIDELSEAVTNDERAIYRGGSGFTMDNKSDLEAIYEREVDVLLKEITIDELDSLFDNVKIKVTWNKLFKGTEERTYYLKDYLNEGN